MFGRKKKENKIDCEECNSLVNEEYDFCPHCGCPLYEEDSEDFGMLGRDDDPYSMDQTNMGAMDKILGSLIGSLAKSLNKEINRSLKEPKTRVQSFPNGVSITMTSSDNQGKKPNMNNQITEKQIKKISKLPRIQAKTNIKRLGNKIIYELSTPGVNSESDVLISKLESGYEIKAISDKKVYVNTIPLSLPMNSLSLDDNTLFVEFRSR